MGRGRSTLPADPQAVLEKKTASSGNWMLMNATGQCTVLDVDKYAIMHRVKIHSRDLRILDPMLSYPSTILGREKAILLNLEHIKAIITADEVLLRDLSDENLAPVVEELKRRLPPANAIREGQAEGKEICVQHDIDSDEEDESPFEFRALEVALEAICSHLDARTREMETAAHLALDELNSKINGRNFDRVHKMKSAMTGLTTRVQKVMIPFIGANFVLPKSMVRDELKQLLEDDDDMADLYLSRKLAGVSLAVRGSNPANWFPASPSIVSKVSRASKGSVATFCEDEDDVEELEMLLEAHLRQMDETMNKLTMLREYIDSTENYVKIQCRNYRNWLIQAELIVNAMNVSLTIYALVAGIFGMNIPYTWNDNHGYMFKWVVIATGLLCLGTFKLIFCYACNKGLIRS
ncbi:hypothetical protein NMG60_11029951, partial [Bertholletia excelsa]